MIETLAISNYRSILKLALPLGRLNVITGANGSGKSNLYRAIRLLAETARDGVVSALAREGGLHSTFWTGPEDLSRRMFSGEVEVQGTYSTGKRSGCGWGLVRRNLAMQYHSAFHHRTSVRIPHFLPVIQ